MAMGGGFEPKLAKAHDHEQRVAEYFNTTHNYSYKQIEGMKTEYDLKCTKTGKTIECKTDAQIEDTGNMFIELKSLIVCEADGFIYENAITGVNYIFNYKMLKEFCVGLLKGGHPTVLGGDGKRSQGLLVPIENVRVMYTAITSTDPMHDIEYEGDNYGKIWNT